jgi:hypothetical protein
VSWNQAVFSSNVDSVGFNSDTEEMEISWKSGKVSAYAGVPEEMALQVANAPSVGQAINSMIKNQYSHRYVR